MATERPDGLTRSTERLCEAMGEVETGLEHLADQLLITGYQLAESLGQAELSALRRQIQELAEAADRCHEYAEHSLAALDGVGLDEEQ